MKNQTTSNFSGIKIILVALFVAAWISVPYFSNSANAGGVPILVRTANLASPTGSINPHGFAEYQLYANGQRELEVESEDMSFPTGTVLTAVINGSNVGQFAVDIDGRARLKLRTEDGQTVPVVNDGDSVSVLNGANIVVAGLFGGGGPGPSPSPTASPSGSPSPSPTASPSPNQSPSPSPSPNSGNLFAALSGGTINGVLPGGYAEFEVHSSRLELEVRVRQVALPAGTATTVIVDGSSVGTLVLEGGGEGRLRLRSDNGQNVPPVVAGSTIQIRNAGSTILSGTFAGFSGPSPTPTPTDSPSPSPSPSMGRSFEAKLVGSGTAATGEFKVTLNADETQATIFGEFHNLNSDQTSAKIETTTGAPVTIQTYGVVGTRNGNFASVNVSVSPAVVQQLRTGLWAATVYSVNSPNGEITGTFSQRSNTSDFDGNGAADLAVFRPTSGTWYSLNEAGYSSDQIGSAGDKIISGDYDGDGKTDSAVFTTAGGFTNWQIKRSSDGGITTESFGLAGDTPLRADFDGDGRNDLAVFRSSNSTWYFRTSGNFGFSVYQFGIAGDIPIPGDMDGDGRDDIAVFRPSNGTWYWLSSSKGNFNVVQFGLNGDTPVRGDFDGDGKNDTAVFRPSDSTWYAILSSNQNFSVIRFGLPGDIPVAADYDNDNITDIAVFRPANSTWYSIRSSTNTINETAFGLFGDVPVSN